MYHHHLDAGGDARGDDIKHGLGGLFTLDNGSVIADFTLDVGCNDRKAVAALQLVGQAEQGRVIDLKLSSCNRRCSRHQFRLFAR